MDYLSKITNMSKQFLQRKSTTILTCLSVVGVVSVGILTTKATIKTVNQIIDDDISEDFEFIDYAKTYYTNFIPPIAIGSLTIGSIIMLNSVQNRRQAAMASILAVAEKSIDTYKDSVVDVVGKNKEEKIRMKTSQKMIDEKPASSSIIESAKGGETLCFDPYSGRYFRSDIETIRRIQNDLNEVRLSWGWVSVNDFYEALGLRGIRLGDCMGWPAEIYIDFKYDAMLSEDIEPCIVLNYDLKIPAWPDVIL